MARPRIEFTDEQRKQIEILARANCTNEEIAAFVDITERTLKRRFGPLLQKSRKAGCSALRAKQYELAMKGNVTMLVWLGKQLLGQTDKQNLEGVAFEPLVISMPNMQNEIRVVDPKQIGVSNAKPSKTTD